MKKPLNEYEINWDEWYGVINYVTAQAVKDEADRILFLGYVKKPELTGGFWPTARQTHYHLETINLDDYDYKEAWKTQIWERPKQEVLKPLSEYSPDWSTWRGEIKYIVCSKGVYGKPALLFGYKENVNYNENLKAWHLSDSWRIFADCDKYNIDSWRTQIWERPKKEVLKPLIEFQINWDSWGEDVKYVMLHHYENRGDVALFGFSKKSDIDVGNEWQRVEQIRSIQKEALCEYDYKEAWKTQIWERPKKEGNDRTKKPLSEYNINWDEWHSAINYVTVNVPSDTPDIYMFFGYMEKPELVNGFMPAVRQLKNIRNDTLNEYDFSSSWMSQIWERPKLDWRDWPNERCQPVPMSDEEASNKDSHYREMNIEPIVIQEQIMGAAAMPAYCLAQAVKYILRAGHKEGASFMDDLVKARNYLHRAITGEWYK